MATHEIDKCIAKKSGRVENITDKQLKSLESQLMKQYKKNYGASITLNYINNSNNTILKGIRKKMYKLKSGYLDVIILFNDVKTVCYDLEHKEPSLSKPHFHSSPYKGKTLNHSELKDEYLKMETWVYKIYAESWNAPAGGTVI